MKSLYNNIVTVKYFQLIERKSNGRKGNSKTRKRGY